jgi:hypothetical protein
MWLIDAPLGSMVKLVYRNIARLMLHLDRPIGICHFEVAIENEKVYKIFARLIAE